MRIVFYSVSVSPYGAPSSLLNFIEGLISVRGNSDNIVVIVPGEGPLTHRLRELKVQLVFLPFFKWTYKDKYFQSLKARNKLYAGLWFTKNMLQKLLLNAVYLPMHLIKVRSLRPDLIYVNASMSPMGIFVAKLLKIKSIWHHREPLNDPDTDFVIEWSASIATSVLNAPTARIYNSNFLKSMYEKTFPGYEKASYVVYNGVPSSGVTKGNDVPGTTFGMVGKIEKGLRKGQDEVIGIFNLEDSRDVVLNVYGTGEPSYLKSLKEKAHPARVKFCGFKKTEEIYTEIDFLIVNSRNESFGRVVAEAYAFGVPVIALRSGALPEIIDDRETGFIYDSREQLVQLVQYASTLKGTDTYRTLQANCRQKHHQNFTIEAYTENLLTVINSVTHA